MSAFCLAKSALQYKAGLNIGQEQEVVENDITTASVVLSMAHVDQRLIDETKASSTDKHPPSGSIVRSIASIRRSLEDVMEASKSTQDFYLEVANLAFMIRIQQVTFESGCKKLLISAAKSRQDVDNMIEDTAHPIWKDMHAHRNLDAVMARFYHPCLAALKHFHGCLNAIKVRLHDLRKPWDKQTVKCQFLPSWSSSPMVGTMESFSKLVDDLRYYNDIFCTLSWQAVQRRPENKFGSLFAKNVGRSYAIRDARDSVYHFSCTQRASQVLFDTLSDTWAYCNRKAHHLNISLNFDSAMAAATIKGKDFRCDVAVTASYRGRPYHLIVKIAHDEFCIYQAVGQDGCLKKNSFGNKGVESPELDAGICAHRAGYKRTVSDSLQRSASDLDMHEDVCCSLRNNIVPEQQTRCSCLGCLKTKNGITFLLSTDESRGRNSHSLDDVLVRANNERRAIPLEDRLRTALFLAAGVLHLNASSWLRQAWSSKDIHFFDMDDYERCALGEPFLQTQADSNIAQGPVSEAKRSAAARSCLFSLGLVLIELAFSAPWRKLQLEKDITKDLLEWEENLLNMLRLKDTVSRELGSRYAKVVQTCLCEGMGARESHSAEKAELDEIMFEDIVRELDRCLYAVTWNSGVYGSPGVALSANDLAFDSVLPSAEYSTGGPEN